MAATIPTNGLVLSSVLNVADGDITLASGHGISFASTSDGTLWHLNYLTIMKRVRIYQL